MMSLGNEETTDIRNWKIAASVYNISLPSLMQGVWSSCLSLQPVSKLCDNEPIKTKQRLLGAKQISDWLLIKLSCKTKAASKQPGCSTHINNK